MLFDPVLHFEYTVRSQPLTSIFTRKEHHVNSQVLNAYRAKYIRESIPHVKRLFHIIEEYKGNTPDGQTFVAGIGSIVRSPLFGRKAAVDALEMLIKKRVLIPRGSIRGVSRDIQRAVCKNNQTIDKKGGIRRTSFRFGLSSTQVYLLDMGKFSSFCREYLQRLREQIK